MCVPLYRKIAVFLLACLILVWGGWLSAYADSVWEDDVEVDLPGFVSLEEEEPQAAEAGEAAEGSEETEMIADKEAPVYQADGSILLTMTFAGDFTIGDNVQSSGKSIFAKELEKQGGNTSFMFRNVKDILLADDLTMINFEGTLTTAGRNVQKKNNEFLFRADPEFASVLAPNGVDTVTLENNHVLDMGEDGLAETKASLANAGITYACEDEPAVFTVKGVKIASLAYQTFGGRHDEIIQKLPEDIAEVREAGCQIVIVSFHWGDELDYYPNKNQVRLAHACIDAGADLVIGHHSHRINPIEYYNGHYICYSLANFSFAGNNKPSDMSSYLFQIRMKLQKDGVTVTQEAFRIIPGRISSRTDYNDFAFTPYTKTENIQAVVKLLTEYGKKLSYPVDSYPLVWPDE